jgi:predicted transcriptional regulator
MSVLTIRVPDAKHQRLKHLAKARGISVNKLIEELSTVALAQHDTEMRFRALAARGSAKRGLKLLDKLDRAFARNSRR